MTETAQKKIYLLVEEWSRPSLTRGSIIIKDGPVLKSENSGFPTVQSGKIY